LTDPTATAGASAELSNAVLIKRLLALSWRYRVGCLKVLGLQIVLLTLGLLSLNFIGLGFDIILHAQQPDRPEPQWPFGLTPPETWTAMQQLAALSAAVVVMALTRAALNYFFAMAVARLIHQQIVVHLRTAVYDKLQRLSFRFFDARDSGSLINRVTGDVQMVRLFVDSVIIQGVILVLSLVVYLVWMVRLSPLLTLACLFSTPFMLAASLWFARRMKRDYRRNRELMDRLILNLNESIQGIQVVKGFAREPEAIARFAAANAAVRDQQRRIFWRISLFGPSIGFAGQLNLAMVVLVGGWLVIRGELALGTGLMVFTGLMQQFYGQVANVTNIANSVQQSMIAARRVFEVLDTPLEVESRPDAVRLRAPRGGLVFSGVDFAYQPGEPVLKGISFAAEPGMCVAILGGTGSGKSTLMSLIPRFYDPTAGRITLDGHELKDLDLDDLRRAIGLVFQESFLFSNTVAANIAFGHPEATPAQIERAARIAKAHEFISELPQGYATVLGESGTSLSGGQRQRLAIARAVLLEPAILLLDDPTAAIDPQTETEILEALENAIHGRTTFIVANRVSTLRRADLILVLEDNTIVQRGTHDQLMAQPGPYRRVAKLQLIDAESLEALGGGHPEDGGHG
jgi:ATP-binding cassette subfamily B protein